MDARDAVVIAAWWSTAVGVASGVLVIAVVVLARWVTDLRDRVSRLEGRLNGDRRR